MHKRTLLISVAAIAAIAGWYAFRPERLFINQKVSESLPSGAAESSSGMVANASTTTSMMPANVEGNAPVALSSGNFHGVHHETQGTATLYRLADGKRVVRFTNFSTSNGPDVRIYLIAASDALDNATVQKAGFVELGPMKGNQGDQNYEIPEGVDLTKYRAVTIWCKRFGVNFATAPLAS
ncbi:MAG: DM13 domain-containing protein [Gemmatimonadota bacterium]